MSHIWNNITNKNVYIEFVLEIEIEIQSLLPRHEK